MTDFTLEKLQDAIEDIKKDSAQIPKDLYPYMKVYEQRNINIFALDYDAFLKDIKEKARGM